MNISQFSDLRNHVIVRFHAEVGEDQARMLLADGRVFTMLHHQDCCEHVRIEDICGDLADLQDALVIDAREETNGAGDDVGDSGTWTFYILQTNKGSVTLRWLGQSNGYYSEGVSFEECEALSEEVAMAQACYLQSVTQEAQSSGKRARL